MTATSTTKATTTPTGTTTPAAIRTGGDQQQDHADDGRQQGQGKEENSQGQDSGHGDQDHREPGRRIEARQLPEDHPARTRTGTR